MGTGPTPAPPFGMDNHGTGGLGVRNPSIAPQDLTSDHLLSSIPRTQTQYGPAPVPELGGIPLLAKLGQGGMGAVYYGIHPRLDIEVAVKVLPFQLAGLQPDLIQRFFREAKVAAQVRSPHLVGVSDVNQQGALYYIVMEFVRGQSAGALVRDAREARRPPLSETDALAITIAATEGLCAAHEAGVIHRDIKPDNIMLPQRREGGYDFAKAKLCDLGLARSESTDKSLTGSFSAMGTPGFMAPEQGLDARTAGKPADIFSMGATLYALLAGHAPFHGSSVMKIMMDTAQQPHLPIRALRPDVSPTTEAVLQRCLAKDPTQRYVDGAALLAALKSCATFPAVLEETARLGARTAAAPPASAPNISLPPASGVPGSAPSVQYATRSPHAGTPLPASHPALPVHAPPRSNRVGLFAAAALLVLALLAGGGYFGWQQHVQNVEKAAARARALERQAATDAALAAWDQTRDRVRNAAKEAGPAGAKVWKLLEARAFGTAQRSELHKHANLGKSLLAEGHATRAEESFAAAEAVAAPALPLAQQAEKLLETLQQLHTDLQRDTAGENKAAFYAPVLRGAKELETGLEGEDLPAAMTKAQSVAADLRAARQAFEAQAKVQPAREAARRYETLPSFKEAWQHAQAASAAGDQAATDGSWLQAQERYQAAAEAFAGFPGLAGKLADDALRLAETRLAEQNYIAAQQALQEAESLRPGNEAATGIKTRLNAARVEARKAAVKQLFATEGEPLNATIALLKEGAAAGDAGALNALGDACFFGRGVERDFKQAGEHYRKAAETGHARAMHNLGELCLYGYAWPKDEAQALRWFEKGAEAGELASTFRLGQCLMSGIATREDKERGRPLVRKALGAGLESQATEDPRAALLAGMYFYNDYFEAKDPAKAEAHFKRAQSHPRAQFYYGFMLLSGQTTAGAGTVPAQEGLRQLEASARAGDTDSMTELGRALSRGAGGEPNPAEARAWLEKAAHLGNAHAMFALGEFFESRQEHDQAFKWFQQAAEAKHAVGMLKLGYAYHMGQGVEKNPAQAVNWYRKAADAGNAGAAFNLGWRHFHGTDLPKDLTQALKYFRQSADGGDPNGQAALGYMYRSGEGIEKNLPKALELFHKGAAGGCANAMLHLGIMHEEGQGVPQDFAKAAQWYQKAEQSGDTGAPRRLAVLYDEGKGVARDSARAAALYRKAAELGDAYSMFAYGVKLYEGTTVPRDEAEGFKWVQRAAEAGDIAGMRYLGYCLESGKGCPADFAKAAQWYRKSADTGDAYAAYNLGRLYRLGQGIPRDPALAVKYLRQSADVVTRDAAQHLGEMYRLGDGIPRDPAQAAFWYRKSAEAGGTDGMFYIAYAYHMGEGVTQDFGQAAHWYRQSAEKGNSSTAMHNLGHMYSRGEGFARNMEQAAAWYHKAAALDYVDSMLNLGVLYVTGEGVGKNLETAFQWFSKAAEKGNIPAMASLGIMYARGEGVRKDFNRALEWLQKGANGGNDAAMYNLGVFHHNGWTVPQDLSQAVYWYRKAAHAGNQDAKLALKALGQQ